MDRLPGAVEINAVRVVRAGPNSPNGLFVATLGHAADGVALNLRSEPVDLTSLIGVSLQEELRPDVGQRTGARRRFVAGIVLGLALLQALWIVSVPPFRASDEFDHAYRAAAVARGQWWATDTAENGRGTLVRVPPDIVDAAHAQCSAMPYTGADNCTAVAGSESDGTVLVASGAGSYNPVYYWVVGTAARPFHGSAALYAMRIASALLCLLFMGLAAWALSLGARTGWRSAGLLLATTPVFVFSTSVAAPNGLEMAAALALWCALLVAPEVADPRTVRRLVLVAALAAMVVVTLRMLGPLFVLLIVALVALFHGRATAGFVIRARRPLLAASCAVAATVGLAAAWTLKAGLVQGAGEQGTSTWSGSTLVLWPLQTIAAFPYRDTPGPILVYPVVGGLVCALTYVALKRARGAQRVALVLSLLVALALPIVLTLVSRDGRGVMWQGRYGLPVAVGFVLIAGLVLDRAGRRPSLRLLFPAGLALAVAGAACVLKVVHHELGRRVSAGDGSWFAPPDWLVVGLVAAAWLAFATAVRTADARAAAAGELAHDPR